MPDVTLDDLMELAHEAALTIATHEELGAPLLVFLRPDNIVGNCVLNIEGAHPSDVAKVVLAQQEATMAALCMESWKVSIEPTPEQRVAFEAGEVPSLGIQPRDHPDHYDALVLIGEIKGQPQVQRHWRIRTEPGRDERLFEEEEVPEGSPQHSRFTPLFVPLAEVQALAYEYLVRGRLPLQAQDGRN